jgi:hypothetical protein
LSEWHFFVFITPSTIYHSKLTFFSHCSLVKCVCG